MDPNSSNLVTTVVFGALMAFMLYRRFRRTFGRQSLGPKRIIFRIVLFGVISSVLVVVSFTPQMLAAALVGAMLGSALGLIGLRHTMLETTAEGRFYTPNGWIGLAVSALFLGRLASRMVTVFGAARAASAEGLPTPFSGVQRSPLTLGIFFVLAAYYVTYLGGVLWKARHLPSASPPVTSR